MAMKPPKARGTGFMRWTFSLAVMDSNSCHPGLEPGSMVQFHVRLWNGPRLKAGVTSERWRERVNGIPSSVSSICRRLRVRDLDPDIALLVAVGLSRILQDPGTAGLGVEHHVDLGIALGQV